VVGLALALVPTSDCVLHERIVMLHPYWKVLSKEQRTRLKE